MENGQEKREISHLHDRWKYIFLLSRISAFVGLILSFLQGNTAKLGQEVLKDELSTKYVLTEPHHATAGDSGQGGVAKVLYLKHDTHLQQDED